MEKSAYNCQQSAVSSQQSAVSSQQSAVVNCLLKFLIVLIKMIISGILALIILSAGCLFYVNVPRHYNTNKDSVHASKMEANVFYCQAREGIGWGHTNNDGYINIEDYVLGSEIEILLMGSSQMQALEVIQEDTTASLLNSKYSMKVYNIGMSGHRFATCAARLKAAVMKYKPSKFAVIEIGAVETTEKNVNDILHNKASELSPNDKGIRSLLRRILYLTLLYRQFNLELNTNNSILEKLASPEAISEMLAKLNKDVSLSGAKLIIAYHPPVSLNKDGTMKIDDDPEVVRQFSELCSENGIYFLNMAGRFLEEYKKDYTLPYGFANTSVGKGHMNVHGHRMFADEIYRLIQRIGAGS